MTGTMDMDRRFARGAALVFVGQPWANKAMLLDSLVKRLRVGLPLFTVSSVDDVEALLRLWVQPDDLNADGVPWDIPALAAEVHPLLLADKEAL